MISHLQTLMLKQDNKVVVTNEDVPFTSRVINFPFKNSPYFPGVELYETTNPAQDYGTEWAQSPVVNVGFFVGITLIIMINK